MMIILFKGCYCFISIWQLTITVFFLLFCKQKFVRLVLHRLNFFGSCFLLLEAYRLVQARYVRIVVLRYSTVLYVQLKSKSQVGIFFLDHSNITPGFVLRILLSTYQQVRRVQMIMMLLY